MGAVAEVRGAGRDLGVVWLVTQAVRSRSWAARSWTTPTSVILAGNGPVRRVTTWKTWPSWPSASRSRIAIRAGVEPLHVPDGGGYAGGMERVGQAACRVRAGGQRLLDQGGHPGGGEPGSQWPAG